MRYQLSTAMLGLGALVLGFSVGCGNDCQPNETLNDGDGNCVPVVVETTEVTCGPGTRLEGRRCVSTDASLLTCGQGTIIRDNRCVPAFACGENTFLDDGECVPAGTVCGRGSVFDADEVKCVNNFADACGDGLVETEIPAPEPEEAEDPADPFIRCDLEDAATLCGEGTALAADGRCVIPATAVLSHDAMNVGEVDIYLVPLGEPLVVGSMPFASLNFDAETQPTTLAAGQSYDVFVAAAGEPSVLDNALLRAVVALEADDDVRVSVTQDMDMNPTVVVTPR